MAAADTARLIAELGLDSRKYDRGMKNAAASTKGFESSLGRVAGGAGKLSAGLTRAGTRIAAGLGAGLAGAAKAAIDWQDAFTGVTKTVDEASLGAGQTFRDIELALRNMATEMPNSAAELAAIAEAGGAMGIAGKDIEAFTRQVAILASTTNVSADDAAMSLGQLQNIIGLTGDEFDNFAASLVQLGNTGNSTEAQILEIERRAGGAAKLFGVAKEETLGWAAAAANLGLNEELAGTALQNVFIKLLPKYSQGAKDLQKITGKTGSELKKAFKEDAGGAVEDLIQQLGQMPKDARLKAVQKLFGKGSGLTRLVLGLAESFDKNLSKSLDDSVTSWHAATAAQEEFDKKNASVRSAISRLRNGVYEAGITLGEGFVPALGRAADKLSAFLKEGKNRDQLMAIGKDIGDAIDEIDWKAVLDGAKQFTGIMKMAFDWAKRLFDIVNVLPTEIKAAGLGVLALDKLSGGLVGSGIAGIAGGAAQGLLSRAPGVGRIFAQPVFVTNWPLGGIGGAGGVGAGAKGGLGALAKGALVAEAIGLAATVFATQQAVSGESTRIAGEVKDKATVFLGQSPTTEQLQTALAGVNKGIDDIRSNPLNVLVAGDALNQLQDIKGDINKKLAVTALQVQRKGEQTVRSVDNSKSILAAKAAENARATAIGASQTSAATRGVAPPIVSAIQANRPEVTVINDIDVSATSVTKQQNTTIRYGPPTGWRESSPGKKRSGPG